MAGFEQLPTAVQPCQSCEVEQTIQITAPHTRVYNLLLNVANMPQWDPTISEVTHIRRNKYLVRTTTLGTLTFGLVGAIPYDRISWQIDGSFMQGVTFRVGLADKLAQVDVMAKVSPTTAASQVEEIIGLQLAALKQYAEYLANGGNPEAYKKSTDLMQGVGWIAT